MRTVLAVMILLAAAFQIGVDWQATIGKGYAFRPGSIGGIMAARWPESHARLVSGLGDGFAGTVAGVVMALPVALLLGAAGYGLWISRPGRRHR